MSDVLIFDVVVDDPVEITVQGAPSVDVVVETPQASDVVVVDVAGPTGPQGPPGVPGEPGPPGPAFNGTAWFYGEGPPVGVVGAKPGDIYVDRADPNFKTYVLGGN